MGTQAEKISAIKKGTFSVMIPVWTITTIRGQVRGDRERKWVKNGLAIVEEERQAYLEEKKQEKQGKKDDDDDDDEDDDEDGDSDGKDGKDGKDGDDAE